MSVAHGDAIGWAPQLRTWQAGSPSSHAVGREWNVSLRIANAEVNEASNAQHSIEGGSSLAMEPRSEYIQLSASIRVEVVDGVLRTGLAERSEPGMPIPAR